MTPPGHHRGAERWLRRSGIAWERLRYPRPEAGGETAAFRFMPAGAPIGRVIAAHGACDDALFPLVGLYRALVAEGLEVFAFDLDGNGWESTTRYAPASARGAVTAAVREAGRDRQELPLHLLGHSVGGALVLDALARGEVEANSAVAISTPLRVRLTSRIILAELAGFLRMETFGQRQYYGLFGLIPAFGPVKRRSYPFRGAASTGNFDYAMTFDALLREIGLLSAAAAIEAPMLLVYGERDRLASAGSGEELAKRLRRGEILRVPDGTHYSTSFHPLTVARVTSWITAHGHPS